VQPFAGSNVHWLSLGIRKGHATPDYAIRPSWPGGKFPGTAAMIGEDLQLCSRKVGRASTSLKATDRSGSISGLQRPLLGRNCRGSVGAARGHTSITREIIAVGK